MAYRVADTVSRRELLAKLVASVVAIVLPLAATTGSAADENRKKAEVSDKLGGQVRFRWQQLERLPEPVLGARPGTWDTRWFVTGSVIRVGDQWWMYYEASGKHDTDSSLGLAVSGDGITWRRHPQNPIWRKGPDSWQHFLRDALVRRFDGEPGFWLYYSDGDRHIDLARSSDGIHWINCVENPVLTVSQPWEQMIMQQYVLKLGPGKWYMWYSTYGRKPRVTGLANSTDGVRWTKYKANPILLTGEPGQWDDYSAFQPVVFRQAGYFHMLYTGSSRRNPTGYRWGHAWSRDGIHWTKSLDNPVFLPGQKGAWDAGKVAGHTIVRTGPETYNIYYAGAPAPHATYVGIGLVRARLKKLDGLDNARP